MINLFDTYNQASWDLHYSLIMSGYQNPTIAINDDGFLPEDVTSPYLYFTGFADMPANPLYFNQIRVPEYWEISGNNSHAAVHDYDQKRAHIHYAHPGHLRCVKAVDWYDEKGRLRVTDRYNKQGYLFSQTSYNQASQATITTYFNKDNQEVIVENHTTGDVILTAEKIIIFKSRSEFVAYYLKVAGYQLDRIFYNSLSTPFLVSYHLGLAGNDVLFWQEELGESIPGNMTLLLNDDVPRPTKIVIQKKKAYEKALDLLPLPLQNKVSFLGFHYPFKRQNHLTNEALILTNSDQLEGIEELLRQIPSLHVHIGALTEMSAKLMALGKYPNVSLYPNISQANVNHLFQTCSFYLDINHGNEILAALRTAFENRMLILAFNNTVHGRDYIADRHCFAPTEIALMSQKLQDLIGNESNMITAIVAQEAAAHLASKEQYQAIIDTF